MRLRRHICIVFLKSLYHQVEKTSKFRSFIKRSSEPLINFQLSQKVINELRMDLFSCSGSSIPDLGQWVGEWVTGCLFRILKQRVTFETSDQENNDNKDNDNKNNDNEDNNNEDNNKEDKNHTDNENENNDNKDNDNGETTAKTTTTKTKTKKRV